MPAAALVTVTVDEASRLITVRFTGNEPGQVYIDQSLAAYDRIEQPWRYNRLIDHRQFRGFMTMVEVQQIDRYWTKRMVGRIERPRVALLTRSALAHARVAASGDMFLDSHFRAFTSRKDAQEWLAQMEAAV